MRNLFPRITAALLWLKERLDLITKHKYGRAIFVFLLVSVLLFVASPVYAKQGITEKVILFLADLGLTVAVLISRLIVVVIQVLLPIMMYNNFSTSAVVSSGWAIVRDTVNMFFVIVLIAIAFGTIFGNSRFQWQQQITKMMIFAIVINFSKTLCGLMIDFGQVVMLTFANAIREVAAGNFVQLFGLGDMYSLSQSSSIFQNGASNSGAEGAKAFDWFCASIASVFMALIVLATMLMLLAILVYRTVMLWVLIVISPLAWFTGGVGKLVRSAAGVYSDWWGKFICLISIGPVLTFFLWLTLVVAGAGNVADGFNADGSAGTAGGMLTTIFEMDKLISFVIAIAMLYAGFQAAQSACKSVSALGGMMAGGPTGSIGARAMKSVAGTAVRVGARGARMTGRVGAKLAKPATREISLATKSGTANVMDKVIKASGNGTFGRVVSGVLTPQKEKLEKAKSQEIEAAGAKFKGLSDAGKVDMLKRYAESPAMTPQGKREQAALLQEVMGNEKMQKELRASGHLEKLWQDKGARQTLEDAAKTDSGLKDKLTSFKKQNADITGSWGQIKNAKDAEGLSIHALAGEGAKENLAKIKSGFTNKATGENYSMAEAIQKGLYGNDKMDALMKGHGAIFEHMSDDELDRVPREVLASNMTEDLMKRAKSEGGPTLGQQMLGNKDVNVQAKLHERLGKEGGDKIRDGLLASAGVEKGKVKDSKAFLDALKSNPAMLGYLTGDQLKSARQDEELHFEMQSALANPNTLKTITAHIKGNPDSAHAKDLRARIKVVLDNPLSNEALDAQRAFGAQMEVVDAKAAGFKSAGAKNKAESNAYMANAAAEEKTVKDQAAAAARKAAQEERDNNDPVIQSQRQQAVMKAADEAMKQEAEAAADRRMAQQAERLRADEERGKAIWEEKQKQTAKEAAKSPKEKEFDSLVAKYNAATDPKERESIRKQLDSIEKS